MNKINKVVDLETEDMTTLSFGFENNPDADIPSWNMGLRENSGIYKGAYCGVVEIDNEHLLVSRIKKDDMNDPQFQGKYIVLPTLADVYVDGSAAIYLNQEPSEISKLVEEKLNESGKNIKNIEDMKNVMPGLHYPSTRIYEHTIRERSDYPIISLTPVAFERMKEGLEAIREMSFSKLGRKILNQNDYGSAYNKQMGFAKVFVLGLITALISIGIIVLGMLLK